jgi:hypothetical protein
MFAPEIRKLMDSITPLLDILRDWMKDNPELTKTIV